MRLQQALEELPQFDGHISYLHRNGRFEYSLGYHGGVVKVKSDQNQSEWSDADVATVIEFYKSEIIRLKSEAGSEL